MCVKCNAKGKTQKHVLQKRAKIWVSDEYGRDVLHTKRPMEYDKGLKEFLKLKKKYGEARVITMEITTATKITITAHGVADTRNAHAGKAMKRLLQQMKRIQQKIESLDKKGFPTRKGKLSP